MSKGFDDLLKKFSECSKKKVAVAVAQDAPVLEAVKAAKEKGMAVFISSHILSEVQNLCDRVAFTNGGVIKSVEDIHDNTMDTELDSLTLIVSSNEEEAVKVLKGIDLVKSASVIDEEIHLIIESGKTSELLGILLNKKIKVEEIFKNRKGLEQRYMELVEGGIR